MLFYRFLIIVFRAFLLWFMATESGVSWRPTKPPPPLPPSNSAQPAVAPLDVFGTVPDGPNPVSVLLPSETTQAPTQALLGGSGGSLLLPSEHPPEIPSVPTLAPQAMHQQAVVPQVARGEGNSRAT